MTALALLLSTILSTASVDPVDSVLPTYPNPFGTRAETYVVIDPQREPSDEVSARERIALYREWQAEQMIAAFAARMAINP